jgi:dienelactone hydrolase
MKDAGGQAPRTEHVARTEQAPRTEHVARYYTSMERLLRLYDREARSMPCDTGGLAEYAAWKAAAREKLRELTGIDRMEACAPAPEEDEAETLEGGVTRRRMLIQTEPGVRMPLYVLKPAGQKGPAPCLIAPHGHCAGAKLAVAGRSDIPAVRDQIQRFNCDYGLQLARAGFVVFAPDARSSGERREWMGQSDAEGAFLNSTCGQLNQMAMGLGYTVAGMWAWDLMRLIDYIETRADCDSSKLACAGLSGGGMQTLWLAALDDRVRAAVVSGYFYGARDALLKLSNNCSCNYVPNLWRYVDMGDIGALVAPRPLMIESGTKDPQNGESGMANVHSQVAVARGAYRLLGAEGSLRHFVFEGAHRWDGTQAAPFLRAALRI